MSEAELQALVAGECERLGLAHYHAHDSRRDTRRSAPGFPDSVIVGSAILYRELKSRDAALKVEQRRWGALISRAGGDWCVWRPEHWENGLIALRLAEIAPRRM